MLNWISELIQKQERISLQKLIVSNVCTYSITAKKDIKNCVYGT